MIRPFNTLMNPFQDCVVVVKTFCCSVAGITNVRSHLVCPNLYTMSAKNTTTDLRLFLTRRPLQDLTLSNSDCFDLHWHTRLLTHPILRLFILPLTYLLRLIIQLSSSCAWPIRSLRMLWTNSSCNTGGCRHLPLIDLVTHDVRTTDPLSFNFSRSFNLLVHSGPL